jgi:uncharacterized protein
MKMALDDVSGVNVIRSYADGRVQVRERAYTTSVVVLPSEVFPGWGPRSVRELRTGDLEPILEHRPEVLIVGTGETQEFPDPAIFTRLMTLGIGFEIMDNAAACRTFNVLLAEDRRVALALMLDPESE